MSTFSEVILKSHKKLASWKARFLSRTSKITLIKANLASSPLHAMNCFKLTKINNEDLDIIIIENSYGYQIWGTMESKFLL